MKWLVGFPLYCVGIVALYAAQYAITVASKFGYDPIYKRSR